MTMSIVHRITGGALYFGTVILAAWLVGGRDRPVGPSIRCNGSSARILGRLVLFGYTWALIHHMLGGMRHLVWDTGYGFGPEAREQLRRGQLIGSVVLTILIWIVAYAVR